LLGIIKKVYLMADDEKLFKGAVVVPWTGEVPPTENELIQALHGEGLISYRWMNGPGDVYSVHSHSFNKVIYVVDGSIEFGLPRRNERINLKIGDRLELAAGILHDARVGSSGVVCLEVYY
jgi:quercetin dioxygenase-like cupin family protein